MATTTNDRAPQEIASAVLAALLLIIVAVVVFAVQRADFPQHDDHVEEHADH